MPSHRNPRDYTLLALDTPTGPRLYAISDEARTRRRTAASWFIGLVFVLMVVCASLSYSKHPGSVTPALAANPTDEIIVKFKTNASQSAINALNASNAVNQVDQIPALGLRVLKVPPTKTAESMAAIYARNPLVQFAEPNSRVKADALPNDSYFSSEWHLSKIQSPSAWEQSRASGVLIAVCDSGFALVPDLTPVLRGDLGWNAVDGSSDWSPIAGHGTLVAGAAAAATDNGLGVSGVGWGAQIIPVRISNLTDGSAYVSDAAKCITYAADNGARAINLSYRMAGYGAIDTAGKYAQGKGAVTVVAGGNDGIDPGWASYSGFIAVSGLTNLDQRASWSNYGSFIDIAAPGVSIVTTKQDGTYGGASGTSLAAPLVTGTLALMFGAKPSLAPADAQALLFANADDCGAVGRDPVCGNGRINASRAVAATLGGITSSPTPASTPVAPTSTPSPTATPQSTVTPIPTATATATRTATPYAADTTAPSVKITKPGTGESVKSTATISGMASDNVGVKKVDVYVDGVLLKSFPSSNFSTNWNTRKVSSGNHTITSIAFDAAGNSSSDTRVVTVTN